MAALFAPPAGRLANRAGQSRLAAAGTGLFGLGCAWWLWRVGASSNYAGEMLPGLLITGAGVGLTLPSLASAATASLPPRRFATGSAVFTMSRQLGFVLGVAILVAILASASGRDPVDRFQDGWLFMAIAAALASATALAIGPLSPLSPRGAPSVVSRRAAEAAPSEASGS